MAKDEGPVRRSSKLSTSTTPRPLHSSTPYRGSNTAKPHRLVVLTPRAGVFLLYADLTGLLWDPSLFWDSACSLTFDGAVRRWTPPFSPEGHGV